MDETREKLRRDLTRLLTAAQAQLAQEGLPVSALVVEFIENYEFGLAYEFMIEDLNEHRAQPSRDAVANLRAAASIMGLDQPFSN